MTAPVTALRGAMGQQSWVQFELDPTISEAAYGMYRRTWRRQLGHPSDPSAPTRQGWINSPINEGKLDRALLAKLAPRMYG